MPPKRRLSKKSTFDDRTNIPQSLTLNALCDGYDDDAPGGGLPEQLEDIGAVGGDVAGAVALGTILWITFGRK
jgi:hypothetical protein